MGAGRSSLDSLAYLRAWTAPEVEEAQERLRRGKSTMVVDRATFDQVLGQRNREVMQIFEYLDADADGQVDTFEVLLTLTLWCCAPWEDKLRLMFRCFDFNSKGVLRFPELALMANTASRVVARFADLPDGLRDFGAVKDNVATAFSGGASGELKREAFEAWFGKSDVAKQLRDFVDRSLAQEAPEAVEVLVRERLRILEYQAQETAEELQRMFEAAEELAPEAKTLCGDSWVTLDGLFERLRTASEAQNSELAELKTALAEEASAGAGGAAALLAPEARARHGRLAKEIGSLNERIREYILEAKKVMGQIIEVCRGADERPETPAMLPPMPAPPEAAADPAAVARRLRILDREMRRRQMFLPVMSADAPTPPPPAAPAAAPAAAASPSPALAVEPAPAALPPPGAQAEAAAEPAAAAAAAAAAAEGGASSAAVSDAGRPPSNAAAAGAGVGLDESNPAAAAADAAAASGGAAPAASATPGASATQTPGAATPAQQEAAAGAAAGAAAAAGAGAEGAGAGGGGAAAAEGEEGAMPVVVAFAAFDPPESTDTQMLTLLPGDEILAMGQDGQGWWYGRKKSDGTEGWFPPSYVQLKEEAAAAGA